MIASNDKHLDQYLKGEDRLSKLYRAGAKEISPPEVDQAVLAKATQSAKSPNRPRWLPAFAVAATLVLSLSLVLNLRKVEMPPSIPEAASVASPDAAGAAMYDERVEMKAEADADASPAPDLRKEPSRSIVADEQLAAMAPPPPSAAMAREQAEASPKVPATVAAVPTEAATQGRMARSAEARVALTETQKIEHLISYVRNMQGSQLIRNGEVHTPQEAADHLQKKRRAAGEHVKTAQDFISLCATRSSTTGQPYLIRDAAGKERPAAELLQEELRRLEGIN